MKKSTLQLLYHLFCSIVIAASALGSGFAQQATVLSPSFAVAGADTVFVLNGADFPIDDSPSRGLKFSMVPKDICDRPRRPQPATPTQYTFSCVFNRPAESVSVKIFDKQKRRSVNVWGGTVQVLAGAPSVKLVTLKGSQNTGQTRIACTAEAACLEVIGDAMETDVLAIEVQGQHLPDSLYLSFPGCEAIRAASSPSPLDRRLYSCRQTQGKGLDRRLEVYATRPDPSVSALFSVVLPWKPSN